MTYKSHWFLILFTLVMPWFDLHAQIPNSQVGFYFNVDGTSIDYAIDFDYEPEKKMEVIHKYGTGFSPGYYYNRSGKKISGLLRYIQNTTDFKFKSSSTDKPVTIFSEECIGFVIGLDSFATLDFSKLTNQKKYKATSPLFAEVVEYAGKLSFYRQFNMESSTTEERFFARFDSSEYFLEFPKKQSEFAAFSINLFKKHNLLVRELQKGVYKFDNLLSLIKKYRYTVAFLNNEKIPLNSSYSELWKPETTYFSRIESIKDSIYRISYYKDTDSIVFTGEYSSFYPKKKNGESIYYYADGTIRKKLIYNDNRLVSGFSNYVNGNPHQVFASTDTGLKYKEVYDTLGKSILNDNGSGSNHIYDSFNKRLIKYEYDHNNLFLVYYLNNNQERVYQFFENNCKLKTGVDVESILEQKVKYPLESIAQNHNGLVLLSCKVDLKGSIGEIKIIKGLDPLIDKELKNFFPYIRANNMIETKKLNGDRVLQEVVIPVEFSLVGFARTQMYNNKFWLQGGLAFQRALMRSLIR